MIVSGEELSIVLIEQSKQSLKRLIFLFEFSVFGIFLFILFEQSIFSSDPVKIDNECCII